MTINREKFIANIVGVVNADGTLHPREIAQCEQIRDRFKFTKTEWKNGERLAGSPGFCFEPTGTFADRVQNLELMLRVAYCDGDAADEEIAKIEQFCKMVGITQDQLDCLNNEVLAELAAETAKCGKCGAELPAGAGFCPACGTPREAAAPSEKLSFSIPEQGIAIAFCESSSQSFAAALELAKSNPHFQECVRNKKRWYLVAYPNEIQQWKPLVDLVGSIRNREVYKDGKLRDWYEVFNWEVMRCYDDRAKSYNKDHYCFGRSYGDGYGQDSLNPWGCRCAKMGWSGYADSWLALGAWEPRRSSDAPVWRFDKDQIRHLYKVNTEKCDVCPCFTPEALERVLDLLPDTVCPETDKHWKYKECYDDQQLNVVQWREKTLEDDFDGMKWRKVTMTREFKTNGVEPADLSYLKRIVTSIFSDNVTSGLFT